MNSYIIPEWPAPAHIKAYTTTRIGGFSTGSYASFNFGERANDDPIALKQNIDKLKHDIQLPKEPTWLNQVHGTRAIDIEQSMPNQEADASFCFNSQDICVITTADCLPILITDRQGSFVAAIHAGWRGLANGVIEETLKHLPHTRHDFLAWLGPGISQPHYEVGLETYHAFTEVLPATQSFFKASIPDHWYADLFGIARCKLQQAGIQAIYGGNHCTYGNPSLFYSFRRDTTTGRMATLIWRIK